MNYEELFRRTKEVLNPDIAKNEMFLFDGVGSGGARVAEEAVRFGVGRIILVDRPGECIEEHNIIRHPLGYSDLGRLKIEALRERLLDINPQCDIEMHSLNIVEDIEAHRKLIDKSTQVYICTDNEPSKHMTNEICVELGKPMLFAGVFDGGCGGEIGRVVPNGACYACMTNYLNRSSAQEEIETFDYTNPNSIHKSTAALNIDIAQIALIHARVGLMTMLAKHDMSEDLQGNYVLFGNRPVEGLFSRMLESEIWTIPKDDKCMICGHLDIDGDLNETANHIINSANNKE